MQKDEAEIGQLFDLNERMQIAVSYSKLSDFDRNGPKILVQRTFVQNEGVHLGSMVDDLIDDFIMGTNNFESNYHIFNGKRPTATLGKLCDIVTANYKEIPDVEEVKKIIEQNGFWSGTKNPQLLEEKFNNKVFWDYLKAKFVSKEKTVATTEDKIWAMDLFDTLLTHKNSRQIFNSDLELISQHKFQISDGVFTLRGALDIIELDHKNKTIRFIDLKTGRNPLMEFKSSFIKWRYYLQEAMYMRAAKEIQKVYGAEDYKLLPFQFLYISTYEKIPFLYEVSEKWHNAAISGFTTKAGYKYRGLEELLQEVKWHMDNKIFNMTREVHEADGYMELDDSFIEIN